jgi:ABC-type multidrug transport system ATPase subunit
LSSHLISELERVFCDDFIIIKDGRVAIQENLPKLRDSHVLIRFARSQQRKWASIPAPALQKIADRFVEWLFPLGRLGEIDHSLLETAEIEPPDLETVYFILAD